MNDITKQLATAVKSLIRVTESLVPDTEYLTGTDAIASQRYKEEAIKNGNTALSAYKAKTERQEKDFLVSIVMTSATGSGVNIKNALYEISATNSDEAEGKAVNKALDDFNGYTVELVCSFACNSE